MTRKILVQADKKFIVDVPDDAVLSFGPWSPPTEKNKPYDYESKKGTLRVYSHKKADILAVFSGVTSFRDLSIGYAEEIAREEGATIWKDDEKGYYRQSKVKSSRQWVTPSIDAGSHPETFPEEDLDSGATE